MDKRFMLITAMSDRTILTEKFVALEDAQKAMHEEMLQMGQVPSSIFSLCSYDDGECGFGGYSAYANDGLNHMDYDWLIVDMEGD